MIFNTYLFKPAVNFKALKSKRTMTIQDFHVLFKSILNLISYSHIKI